MNAEEIAKVSIKIANAVLKVLRKEFIGKEKDDDNSRKDSGKNNSDNTNERKS